MNAISTGRAARPLRGPLLLSAALMSIAGVTFALHARSNAGRGAPGPALQRPALVATAAAAPAAPSAPPLFASEAELVRARAAGLSHFELAHSELALQLLVPVYRARPEDDVVALALVETSLRKRDYDTAQSVIAGLRAPETPDALRVRGMLLEQASKLDAALALYDRAIPGLRDPLPTMERKARVLSWRERFEESAAVYAAIVASPSVGVALQRRCRARMAELTAWKKDFDGALAQLAALLAEDPQVTEALLVQGQVLEWQGRYVEAKRSYSNVLAFQPDNPEARLRLNNLLWVK